MKSSYHSTVTSVLIDSNTVIRLEDLSMMVRRDDKITFHLTSGREVIVAFASKANAAKTFKSIYESAFLLGDNND